MSIAQPAERAGGDGVNADWHDIPFHDFLPKMEAILLTMYLGSRTAAALYELKIGLAQTPQLIFHDSPQP